MQKTLDIPTTTARPSATVEVLLEGGPADIPRTLLVTADVAAAKKIKLPRLAGYEHFERPAGADVFVWTNRTRIAE